MNIEEAIAEEAVTAAWNQFQRMPSSNPSDFAHAVRRALVPLVKRAQAEALREAAKELTESTKELDPNNGHDLAYINCTAIDVRELLIRADRIESEVSGV